MKNPNEAERIDMMEYLLALYRRKWTIAAATVLTAAVAVILALKQKPLWISTARMLPSDTKSESPGLIGLAALAGISMPQSASPEAFYRDILLSNDFLDTLLRIRWKTSLKGGGEKTIAEVYELKVDSSKPGWEEKFRQGAVQFIRKRRIVDFEREPSGLMTLTTMTIDPELSFHLNAFLLDRLDEYNRVRKKTRTSEKKALIEQRLQEVEAGLKQSEERLRSFRERNISVSTPALMLEQQRLLREVEVNGALYQELRKQYEITKIEIVDNTQFLNILERPVVSTLPGKSKRRKLVMLLTVFGFLGSSLVVIAMEKFKSVRAAAAARAA